MRKTKRIETPWRSLASETDKESKVFIKRLNLQIYRELQLIALIVYTSWNYYCRYYHYLVIYATECETGCRSTEINARNVDRVPIQDRTIINAQKNSRGQWSQSALYRRSHSFSHRAVLTSFSPRDCNSHSPPRSREVPRWFRFFHDFSAHFSRISTCLMKRMHTCERRGVHGNVDGTTDCHWSAQEGDSRGAGGRSEELERRKDIKQALRR